ncbi:hypothetical protein BC938DRAFT_478906 [Jimgerdemannia flammicorona]|uniref:Uncharacterized protein n=1 Tax=Jimgerdemannia flammicorona TaxID=994334 RepID=A0A433QM27_9FUNG|nr:hypothetical protein BC938DRAFT_478906 [Jimgerdemannia flammicorona]
MSLNQPSSSDKPPPQPEDYVVAPGPGVDPVVYWLQHMWTAYKYACYFEKHPFYSEFFNLYVRTQLAMEVLRSHDSRAYALEWFRKTVAEVNRIRDRLTIIGDRNPELLDDYAERCLRASYALMVQRLQTVIIYYEYLEERYQQFQREGDKSETNQENTEEKKMTENNDFSPTAAGEPPPQQEKQATLTDKDESKVGALNLDQTTATGTSSKKPATIGPQPGVTTDPKDNTMTQGNTQPAPGPGTVGQPLQQMTYPDGRPRPSYSWRNRVYGHPGSTTNTPQPSLDPEMTGQLSSQAIEDHNPAESRKRKQYSSQDNGDDDVGDHEAAATSSDGVSGVAKKGRTSGETIGGMNGTGSGPDQNVDNFQSGNVDVDVNSSIQIEYDPEILALLRDQMLGLSTQQTSNGTAELTQAAPRSDTYVMMSQQPGPNMLHEVVPSAQLQQLPIAGISRSTTIWLSPCKPGRAFRFPTKPRSKHFANVIHIVSTNDFSSFRSKVADTKEIDIRSIFDILYIILINTYPGES